MHLFKEDLQTLLKRTRYEYKRVHGKRQQYNDYLPKMTKPLLPLDKYGQPLELPKPNTTNNHDSKFIGYVAGLLVIDRQMKKCLGCKNSWPPEKNIKSAEAE
jgi:hypothetical protein